MREDEPSPASGLRRGWTTGACATAAARAACSALFGCGFPDPVTIRLPGGRSACFTLAEARLEEDRAVAAVVKDAGDDPDVTHGCLIRAALRLLPRGRGVVFRAGEGVGTVTLPGLPLAVGEPAINPVPRRMMREAVAEIAHARGRSPDVEIEISIPGGERLAARTWNPRLGILGGLSVLGTTGVVVPYSCSAWIHSIHRGIDVARAAGLRHVGAAAGSTSEQLLRRLYRLPEIGVIDMGDFVGGMLKYLRRHPIPRLSLVGGFGKFVKLAQGALDLHSKRSTIDFERLAAWAGELGAPAPVADAIRHANSALEVLELARDPVPGLARRVAERALAVAREVAGDRVTMEVLLVDRQGRLIARAPDP